MAMKALALAPHRPASFRAAEARHLRSRQPLAAPQRPRLRVSCALHDPWSTLGVPHNASEKEVKQAHRRLVKQHHPDASKSDDPLAHATFLRIQEAYELITGKRAGKDIDQCPAAKGGWSFHDWYWSFSMKRRKGGAAAAAGPSEPPPGFWRQQMAGLKHKAAAKRWKQQARRRPHAAEAAEASAAGAGPSTSSAAREQVWRSMTKNARNSDEAAAQQGVEGAALGATGPVRAVGAGAAAQPAQQQPRKEARRQKPLQQQRQEQQHHHHAAAAAEEEAAHIGGSSSHAERLQRLMQRAAAVVQQGAEGAAAQGRHAAAAAGRHLRGHLTLEQLSSLLGGQAAQHHQPPAGEAGNAVAADAHLHSRFERRRREQLHAEQAAAAAAAGSHAAQAPAHVSPEAAPLSHLGGEQGQQQQEAGPQGQPYGSSHARKFADRGGVEERLNTQLAGLKRRAALKQEVETRC